MKQIRHSATALLALALFALPAIGDTKMTMQEGTGIAGDGAELRIAVGIDEGQDHQGRNLAGVFHPWVRRTAGAGHGWKTPARFRPW